MFKAREWHILQILKYPELTDLELMKFYCTTVKQ